MTTQPHLRVVAPGDRPPPLLPPDIDLGDLPEVMLNIQWLCDSRFAITANPEERIAAICLHARSVHEKPAATLPDDEMELAFLSGYGRDIAGWRRVRERALEGWTLCSDGRYYRKDMAVKALTAWLKRLADRRKQASGVATRKKAQFDPEPYDRPIADAVSALYALAPHAPILRKHMNTAIAVGARRSNDATDIVPDNYRENVPDSLKESKAKRSEPSEYISPTAQAVGAGLPVGDSGSREPQPGSAVLPARHTPWTNEQWGYLWEEYDYKVHKPDARSAWDDLAPDPPISFTELMLSVVRYKRCKPPANAMAHLATWLNNRRWEDAYPEPPDRRGPPPGGSRSGGRVPFQPTSYRGRGS